MNEQIEVGGVVHRISYVPLVGLTLNGVLIATNNCTEAVTRALRAAQPKPVEQKEPEMAQAESKHEFKVGDRVTADQLPDALGTILAIDGGVAWIKFDPHPTLPVGHYSYQLRYVRHAATQPDPSPEARAAATELFGKMFARNCTTEQIATIIDRHFAKKSAVVEAAKKAHAWVAVVFPDDLSREMIEFSDALDALEATDDQR